MCKLDDLTKLKSKKLLPPGAYKDVCYLRSGIYSSTKKVKFTGTSRGTENR